jgi:hypothetical protein
MFRVGKGLKAALRDICGRPPLASTFFDVLNDLVGCGHMSGLLVRSLYPLALMKSDDRDPNQRGELCARGTERVVPGFRLRPCRSSRLFAPAKLEPIILLGGHCMRRQTALLRLRKHLDAEAFAGLHHRPEDPGELVGQRYRDESRRLLGE